MPSLRNAATAVGVYDTPLRLLVFDAKGVQLATTIHRLQPWLDHQAMVCHNGLFKVPGRALGRAALPNDDNRFLKAGTGRVAPYNLVVQFNVFFERSMRNAHAR